MDAERLAAIAARAEAATEGPWLSSHNITENTYDVSVLYADGIGVVIADCRRRAADAEFIAHARQDVPDLIAALQAAEAEVERLRELLHDCRENSTTLRELVDGRDAGEANLREHILALTAERDAARAQVRVVEALHKPETKTRLTEKCVTTHYHHRSDPKADPWLPTCDEEYTFCAHESEKYRHVDYPCATVRAIAGATP